jgi:hypothetical protein
MYLFTRRAAITGQAGVEWAAAVSDRANELVIGEIQLWAVQYSTGFGNLVWSSWWESLTSMDESFARLGADPRYLSLVAEAQAMVAGGVDDSLAILAHGTVEAITSARCVASVSSVCAPGHLIAGTIGGIELAVEAARITGVPMQFLTNVTGAYGGVAWLTGFESIGGFDDWETRLSTEPGYGTYIDDRTPNYIENVSVTQSTLYRLIS